MNIDHNYDVQHGTARPYSLAYSYIEVTSSHALRHIFDSPRPPNPIKEVHPAHPRSLASNVSKHVEVFKPPLCRSS